MLNTITYGGICSSVFKITRGTERHSILPEQRKYVKEIPLLDGDIDFKIGGYGTRLITVPLFFDGNYSELRQNREKIVVWLASDKGASKQLIFDDEPNKYYLAKIYNVIDFENSEDRLIGSVTFECNPPWQFENNVLLTPEEIAWNNYDTYKDNQYSKTFTANGSFKLTNKGTMTALPKIYLIGYFPFGITLTCGQQQFKFNNSLNFDGIIIDCENETVIRLSDNSNMMMYVDSIKDDFFKLPVGNNEIKITANGLMSYPNNLTIIVEFVPQNMG